MDSRQQARAMELRALAEKVVKQRGTWIDSNIPNRMVMMFSDRNLQIVYREPLDISDDDSSIRDSFDRKGGTPLIEHFAVDIFLIPPPHRLTETKVFTAFWKQGGTAIEIETYEPGPWEKWIEELAAENRQRVVH